ncbi:MAG: hypothetical protein E7501_03795 [Ruminococcus sp.]|nr:hypothetical protein [Ruminococcus sp.]MBQ8904788.1 hypothetical protein [Ruminococcus sp.]
MQGVGERAFIFLIGYFTYALIEVAARGFTHWTMAVTGGVVMLYLYEMELRTQIPLWQRCILGAMFITAMEFAVGVIDNLLFGWQVWDYSDVPLNLAGQICLPFTILWFFISIPACLICRVVRRKFHTDQGSNLSGTIFPE